MSLSPEVAGALRMLLTQATAKSEEEAALIHRCWIEIRESEAPLSTLTLTEGTITQGGPT